MVDIFISFDSKENIKNVFNELYRSCEIIDTKKIKENNGDFENSKNVLNKLFIFKKIQNILIEKIQNNKSILYLIDPLQKENIKEIVRFFDGIELKLDVHLNLYLIDINDTISHEHYINFNNIL